MVDILQVLEGATYLAFIVGAIAAVYELRDLRKTRDLEVNLRLNDSWLNRDFVAATVKLRKVNFTTGKEFEDQGLDVDAKYVADLFDAYAGMIRTGMIDRRTVDLDFSTCYGKLEPWILDLERGTPERYDDLRWAASQSPKWNLELTKRHRRTEG